RTRNGAPPGTPNPSGRDAGEGRAGPARAAAAPGRGRRGRAGAGAAAARARRRALRGDGADEERMERRSLTSGPRGGRRGGAGRPSSHTVGPMRAAARVARDVLDDPETGARVADVSVHLYGSLAATAAGHGTLGAVVMGLEGEDPESVDPVAGLARVARIEEKGGLRLDGRLPIGLRPSSIVLHPLTFLPQHSNGMTFIALDADGEELRRRAMFSVGGGFVVDEDDMDRSIAEVAAEGEGRAVFTTGDELLRVCEDRGIPVSEA